jgi:hypothetical protein
MRERIESALTWLEDHGLSPWLQHLFLTDRGSRVYLRDYWVGEASREQDDAQHAAILKSLDGQIAIVREGQTSREFTIRPTDNLWVTWTVFYRVHEPVVQPEEPASVVIAEGYCR